MQERSGSYVIPTLEEGQPRRQPKPLIIATCNPSPGWVKKTVYTPHKEGTLKTAWKYIQARIFDNPYIPQEYLDTLKGLPYYHYRVYVEGDWDFRSPSKNAYWRSFDLNKHVQVKHFNPYMPIHVSIDSNVLPYIAITFWQLLTPGHAVQIAELPAEDPNNTAQGAAEVTIKLLNKMDHKDMVILHGDASAKAKNTIDPEKRSFIKLYKNKLGEDFIVKDRVANSNPSVSLRGEFINAIYHGIIPGLEITINEDCKESINDYIVVQQDMNGGMMKKKITKNGLTYEPNGHMSDTEAYFLCDVFKAQFNEFKNAGSTHEYILKIEDNYNEM